MHFPIQMSESLGYDWAPLDDEYIPDCVWFPYDVFDNSPETYYLPSLLEGQIPTMWYVHQTTQLMHYDYRHGSKTNAEKSTLQSIKQAVELL